MVNKVIKNKAVTVSGLCGVLASITFFISILLAIYTSASFRWTGNALSDLGVEATSSAYFNIGLIISGTLLFIFSLGLPKTNSNKIGFYLLSIASLTLAGIGLFPENLFVPHYIVSATFFVSFSFALLVTGLTFVRMQYDRTMGIIACLISFVAFFSMVLLYFFEGIAIPEAFACFPGFVWCQSYGVKIVLNA